MRHEDLHLYLAHRHTNVQWKDCASQVKPFVNRTFRCRSCPDVMGTVCVRNELVVRQCRLGKHVGQSSVVSRSKLGAVPHSLVSANNNHCVIGLLLDSDVASFAIELWQFRICPAKHSASVSCKHIVAMVSPDVRGDRDHSLVPMIRDLTVPERHERILPESRPWRFFVACLKPLRVKRRVTRPDQDTQIVRQKRIDVPSY